MKGLAKASVVSAFSLASLTACANDVDSAGVTVSHSGSIPSIKGTTQRFTGQVRIDPLFQSDAPSRLSGGMVTFEPGSRTAWHTHPLGQTLLVTSGTGWIQQLGAGTSANRCWRRRIDSCWRQALARCDVFHGYDTYSASRGTRWQERQLA